MFTYDLKLDSLAIQLDGSDFLLPLSDLMLLVGRTAIGAIRRLTYEVDTNGRDIGFGICVVGESKQQARLSDSGVTDEQELEQVIVSGGCWSDGFVGGVLRNGSACDRF
jgi:hypothetical protein